MKVYYGIGLMSGTSLDGLDICYVRMGFPDFQYEILEANTIEYDEDWKNRLVNSIHLSGEELTQLDVEYGHYLGEMTADFIQKHQIENTDFIASHGHTVFHNPSARYTLQIGNGSAIWAKTGIKTIYDFRTQDVILGGQGAPLVPIGDRILFSNYDACLNLGGFSNISFERKEHRIAFDICPVNIVLNQLTRKLGKAFDENGELAKAGQIDKNLLDELNQLGFYHSNPPKSLGIEWCNEFIYPLFEKFDLSIQDLISTFTAHSAIQIANVLNQNEIKNVLMTGGGAFNGFLIQSIQEKAKTELILGEDILIEYKEALIFALMGMLRLENQINVLSSVTAASRDHSTGIVVG